jgi:hypothetical protein
MAVFWYKLADDLEIFTVSTISYFNCKFSNSVLHSSYKFVFII